MSLYTSYVGIISGKPFFTLIRAARLCRTCSCCKRTRCSHCMSHGTHTNDFCHIYNWVTSHVWMSTCSCCKRTRGSHCMSRGTRMTEFCHTSGWALTVVAKEWGALTVCVVAHIWLSFVTHVNEHLQLLPKNEVLSLYESWHTYDESHHTYEWVMPHVWMSTCSCYKKEWGALTHIGMSHVTDIKESRHTYKRALVAVAKKRGASTVWVMSHILQVTSHINRSHVTHLNEHFLLLQKNEVLSLICVSHVTHVNVSLHT